MRKFLILLSLQLSLFAMAQPKITALKKEEIPSSIKYPGNLVFAVKFKDSLGNNIVIATETGEMESKNASDDGDNKDANLYASQYIVTGDSAKLLWKLNDYERECPFDISVSFIKKAFSITDIDKDGKYEIWLMYVLACKSDVSPATLKLFMYENGVKAVMRGSTKVNTGENTFMGGEYTFDEKFKTASKEIKTYAEKLWKKNSLETWE